MFVVLDCALWVSWMVVILLVKSSFIVFISMSLACMLCCKRLFSSVSWDNLELQVKSPALLSSVVLGGMPRVACGLMSVGISSQTLLTAGHVGGMRLSAC